MNGSDYATQEPHVRSSGLWPSEAGAGRSVVVVPDTRRLRELERTAAMIVRLNYLGLNVLPICESDALPFARQRLCHNIVLAPVNIALALATMSDAWIDSGCE
jgi:hypothetical protein